MKTKIIPFDLETAEKIQAGEIAGAIKTRKGLSVKTLRTNMKAAQCVTAVVKLDNSEFLGSFYASGKFYWGSESSDLDLVLEVPDEPQFKPFDKVLVRQNNLAQWRASFYSHLHLYENYVYYVTTDGMCYMENNIIPYEGNEHLVGTTDKPKEE